MNPLIAFLFIVLSFSVFWPLTSNKCRKAKRIQEIYYVGKVCILKAYYQRFYLRNK